MKAFKTSAIALIVTAGVINPVLATNGYFTHGTGTKAKGMAGAGLADPEEPIALATNPAAGVLTEQTFGVGLSIFSPRRSYSATQSLANGQGGAFTIDAGKVDSGSEWFPIPSVAKVWQSDDHAWGVAFYGRGGMNTDWKSGSATFDPDGPGPAPVMSLPGTFGGGKAGVDLSQAFLDLNYSQRATDNFSWGASLIVGIQSFQANGVGTFAGFTESFAASGGTAFPANLSNNDHETSTGVGAKLGLHYQVNDGFALAASYTSEIDMSELDDYADLFADGGDFDIPASVNVGVSFAAGDSMVWNLDVEHVWFSEVGSVGNPMTNLFACPTAGAGGTSLASCLGGNNGGGFGWDDVTTYKLGMRWQRDDRWTWRFGVSQTDQPINQSHLFNILAPAVVETHLTAGFTRQLDGGREFSTSFMYAPEKSIRGGNDFDPTQTIELEMDQFELEFSYGWR